MTIAVQKKYYFMRTLNTLSILLLLLLPLLSCDKSNIEDPKEGTEEDQFDPNKPFWIPNWHVDTLHQGDFGYLKKYDPIYTYSRGDTSLISYKGQEFYIWVQKSEDNLPITANAQSYPVLFALQPMDSTYSPHPRSNMCNTAFPRKFYKEIYDQWYGQPMGLNIFADDLNIPKPEKKGPDYIFFKAKAKKPGG